MSTPTDHLPEASTVPDSERKGGCSAMPCSVLWLSLPDADAEVLARLKSGDTFTTDQEQAARLAQFGVKVMRLDRIDGGLHARDLTEVLARCDDRGWEMRGEPALNRPNADVDTSADTATPTTQKPQ